jgi:L-cysteine/cystine lyase
MVSNLAPINIEEYRKQFLGLTDKVYFNFGGQGTMPLKSLDAINEAYKYIHQIGPFSKQANLWLEQKIALLKETIAQELGVTAATITLTENVTAGCDIVLWGMSWLQGDRILMTECEHPGIIAIVNEIVRRFGVEIDICPIMKTLNAGDPLSAIADNLQEKTKLVIISHLLWNTGQVLPLAEIVRTCHNYRERIPVLVDAAQSVGSLPLNLTELEVDFYAFTGHKWWCGPVGVGGLYVSPQMKDVIAPTFIGWRSINTDLNHQPISWKEDGAKFEVATSAYPQYEGLREAILTHQQWGDGQSRYRQICYLSQYLWENLQSLKGVRCLKQTPPEAGLISFKIEADPTGERAVQILERQGFMLRTIASPKCIRAGVHYFTTKEDIDKLLIAIANLEL